MALPSSYLTSFKNVPAMLDAIQQAQAPDRFTVKFLRDLGFASSSDRLFIKMLKTLGLLRESGEPTDAYHEFLDPSLSGKVLAEALREAYADLFQINKDAQKMTSGEVKAKFKTISKGDYSDAVLSKMASTFVNFVKHADFEALGSVDVTVDEPESQAEESSATPKVDTSSHEADSSQRSGRPRLVYNINIHLPTTRDPAVYDALFSSMKKHLGL